MKKILLLLPLAICLWVSTAAAQVAIHAGYSPEKWVFAPSDNPDNTSTLAFNSYFAGVDFRAKIVGEFAVTLGLQGRWSVESGTDDSRFQFDTNHRTNLVAAEIPLLLNYKFKITDNFGITPYLGPKFTYYIKGRTRDSSGHPVNEWFDDEDQAKRMKHFGISGTAGLDINIYAFHIYGGFTLGLTDMDNLETQTTIHGGAFAGLMFGF